MKITRKSTADEIKALLDTVRDDFKALEKLGRQCTPKQLFEIVVPWGAANRPELKDVLGEEKGVVHIEVKDDDDDGWYTITIEGGRMQVAPGKNGKAVLGVHMDIYTFEDLAKGELDPPMAYAQSRIKFSGDASMGVRMMGRIRKYI